MPHFRRARRVGRDIIFQGDGQLATRRGAGLRRFAEHLHAARALVGSS